MYIKIYLKIENHLKLHILENLHERKIPNYNNTDSSNEGSDTEVT